MGRGGWCTVSAGTVNLKMKFDPVPMRRGVAAFGHAIGRMRIALNSHHLTDRQVGQRELDLGNEIAAQFPGLWECFCVTTSEGRCRVISRPRGGWAR